MSNKTIQIIERRINNILFKLCLFITLIAMAMILIEFFTRGEFPPNRIGIFYVGVLLIYSLHKEALRWIEKGGEELEQKRGEYFVYGWIVFTTILYLINFLKKDYFSFSPSGQELFVLPEMTLTTLEVCGVFIFTRLFKIGTIYFFKEKKNNGEVG